MAWLAARFAGWQIAAGFAVCALIALGASYSLGRIHEARIGAAALSSYKENAGIETVRVIKGETQVVIKTEIEYRDRVQKIYVQGEKIEKAIPDYVQPADDARFAVNAGFLRIVDGAWAGEIAGPASDADREPSAIPISEVARVQAANATSCRAWRDKVIGWRAFYADQQVVINGVAGDWYHPSTTTEEK